MELKKHHKWILGGFGTFVLIYIIVSEKERLALVKNLKIVDKAILGDMQNFLKPIINEKPAVVCLGYDHKLKVKELQTKLSELGLFPVIKRAKAYFSNKYKSTHLRRIMG